MDPKRYTMPWEAWESYNGDLSLDFGGGGLEMIGGKLHEKAKSSSPAAGGGKSKGGERTGHSFHTRKAIRKAVDEHVKSKAYQVGTPVHWMGVNTYGQDSVQCNLWDRYLGIAIIGPSDSVITVMI